MKRRIQIIAAQIDLKRLLLQLSIYKVKFLHLLIVLIS